MDAPLSQVFFPASFHELFSAWSRFPDAKPYAGGTDIVWRQGKNTLTLPPIILCLDKLEELHRITRTERYLEIGAMSKLNQIYRLGKIVPEIFSACLENIAGVQLRNIATIGGNICCPARLLDTSAPLAALDALFEIRGAHSSRWVSSSRFFTTDEGASLESQELLTRIRLPLDQWDYSVYKKFSKVDITDSEIMVFLAKTQKNILTDLRVVFKTNTILRNKAGEGLLIGKHLPLSRKIAGDFVQNWLEFLDENHEMSDFTKNELINCIEINIFNLSE
ncbi:MAG: FAD binding domain-containing protein [Treponema sp.]|jgi:CO/xanthine dehydrogenase FAD-binding subunit|nr:FAD binding domain-containing protein [Treponema sp.]